MRKLKTGVFLGTVVIALFTLFAFSKWLRLPWQGAVPIACLIGVLAWGFLAACFKLQSDLGTKISQWLTIVATASGLLFLSLNVARHPSLVVTCRDLPTEVPTFEVEAIVLLEIRSPAFLRILQPLRLKIANRGTAVTREPQVRLLVGEQLVLDRLVIMDEKQRLLAVTGPLKRVSWIVGEDFREAVLTLPPLQPGRALDLYVRFARPGNVSLPFETTLEIQTITEENIQDFEFGLNVDDQGGVRCTRK